MLPVADGCGSFNRYVLYGRDNIINPYQALATQTNRTAGSISTTLPNLRRWELFVVARYACNGTDTLVSDTIFVDDQPPALLNPDSVSVDMATQLVVAGWTRAPEPDVMGYSVFKVDPGTGNNILINEIDSTDYRFNVSTFNSTNPNNRIAIAVFDSCRNGGIISNYHSPVCVSYSWTGNTNYRCDRRFTFGWTPYVGWTTDHYSIWYMDDVNNTWNHVADIPGNSTSYTFNIPNLNRTYRFFVRSHRTSSPTVFTSTSNIIQVPLPGHPEPAFNNIGHASVISNQSVEVTGVWDRPGAGYTARLESSTDGSTWNTAFNISNTSFRYTFNNLNTAASTYHYRIVVINPCNEPVDTSEEHETIRLQRTGVNLNWNPYQPYLSASDEALYQRIKGSSTWNNTGGNGGFHMLTDTSQPECFRVIAYNTIAGNRTDTAYSNEVCIRVVDTTLIPSGFNPEGNQKRFQIVNPNLEPGQAIMIIYDRWGGKIWEGEALNGWDGFINQQPAITGIYVYQVRITRIEKRELYNGTLMLLR